ncbi:MAG: DUF3107 domain-containing protein [Acidimicrobiales bacterium]
MDVRIGVTNTAREIDVELPDNADPDQLAAQIEKSLATEHGMLWLTDRRGRRVGIPADKVAYVEVDTNSQERRVGFGAAMK